MKAQVQVSKDEAEALLKIISKEKAGAEIKLKAAEPALAEAEAALQVSFPSLIHYLARVTTTDYYFWITDYQRKRYFNGAKIGKTAVSDYPDYGLRYNSIRQTFGSGETRSRETVLVRFMGRSLESNVRNIINCPRLINQMRNS